MKRHHRFLLFFILFITNQVFAQESFEMNENRFAFGVSGMTFFKKLGFRPALFARYSFKSNFGDENAFSGQVFSIKKIQDPLHLQAKLPSTKPYFVDSVVNYKTTYASFMFHTHFYLNGTQYNDWYGMYVGGAAGLTLINYTPDFEYDPIRYNSVPSYAYRISNITLCAQPVFGAHYMFAPQTRVFGEAGFFYFHDNQAAKHLEKPNYVSFTISVGLALGIGGNGSRF